ncbi:hypothetical protein PHYSODRAFT_345009 [Phytophthora sojae]|uniref:MULE transposase domain-containing protein n=1 Tax=Phytophthora sojae (strain P6497) TaxID=1094619 RepID=G4YY14_PHYSP|nr:hypothetical protein PHYSODRAFT_345009 [Phytophthora sojae]EGZ25717.1 hypothetical protein PHYSODRAFT_345009 [Phytophthora sojae]|eukprot:XP_009521005.1 hypothetical protein PHYSODRAFT_345009 [Phytophthora sojae]
MQLLEVAATRKATRMTIARANPANSSDVGAATATRLLRDPPKAANCALPAELLLLDLSKTPAQAADTNLLLLRLLKTHVRVAVKQSPMLLDLPNDPVHVADTKPSSLNPVPLDLPKTPVPAGVAQLPLLDPVMLVDLPKAPGHTTGAQLSLLDPSGLGWLKGLAHAVAGACLQHAVILRRARQVKKGVSLYLRPEPTTKNPKVEEVIVSVIGAKPTAPLLRLVTGTTGAIVVPHVLAAAIVYAEVMAVDAEAMTMGADMMAAQHLDHEWQLQQLMMSVFGKTAEPKRLGNDGGQAEVGARGEDAFSSEENSDTGRNGGDDDLNVASGSDIAPYESDADGPSSISPPPKRAHSLSPPPCEDTAPARKKRDGRTKLYVDGYELTRSASTQYDFANSIPHTCVPPPPSMQATTLTETGVVDVTAEMKREVDKLATSTVATPLQIWDEISTKYYRTAAKNTAIRGMARCQVIQRVHHARALHYGTDKQQLAVLQFRHVWENTDNELGRLIGWANPSLLSLLRYKNITLFVDGTLRCVPDTFAQCVVIMVYDRGAKLYVPVFFTLKPKEVVCGFEAALINAVSDWFPSASVIGSLFHFKQACKRSMVKYRIHEDQSAIQERCAKDNIIYSASKWVSLWKYFERMVEVITA